MSELIDTTGLKIWSCKIGECPDEALPIAADSPMRDAVAETYRCISGHEPHFIFSGWGAELTESERACVENRLPDPAKDDAAQRAQREQDRKRIQELEEWQRNVVGAGDQEAVIRMAATEYTKTAVQCWRDRVAALEQERDEWKERHERFADAVRGDFNEMTLALAQARAVIEAAKAVDATWNFQPGDEQSPPVYMDLIDTEALMALRKALAALAVPAAGGGEKPSKDYGIYSPEVERDLSENYTSSSARDAAAPAPTPGPLPEPKGA